MANYPGTKPVGVAFDVRKKLKNFPSCVHVLYKTSNLVISRCCFAENIKNVPICKTRIQSDCFCSLDQKNYCIGRIEDCWRRPTVANNTHLTQSCLRENTIITTYAGSDVSSQRLTQNVLKIHLSIDLSFNIIFYSFR